MGGQCGAFDRMEAVWFYPHPCAKVISSDFDIIVRTKSIL